MEATVEQLVTATQQGNWRVVNQCLQQVSWDTAVEFEQVLHSSLQVLSYGDFRERWEVAKIIPKLGEPVIKPLLLIIEDEAADVEVRWFAVRILGEFNEPQVILSLVNLVQSTEEEDLSIAATAALSNIGNDAIVALSELLKDEKSRLLAVKSLSQIRRSSTIEPLISVVNDINPEIRAIAIEALGSFHEEILIPIFIQALQDTSTAVRKEAVIALGMRGKSQGKFDLVKQLQPLLYDLNLEVCQQSAIALGRMKDEEGVEALFQVLISTTAPILLKKEIIRVLSWSGSQPALVYLEKILYANNLEPYKEKLCQEIVTVLGNQKLPQLRFKSAQILINFLNSEQETASVSKIKQAIATSLGELRELSALASLEQLARDPEQVVRLHAIAALKKLH
ncbi:MAG: HEAT repeat domain-containing protein [Calothrix sp. MO_192.B10]|nr:HEAT repeat domain-containing protein [Calothrix sp. MO_192.B10]